MLGSAIAQLTFEGCAVGLFVGEVDGGSQPKNNQTVLSLPKSHSSAVNTSFSPVIMPGSYTMHLTTLSTK